MHRDKLALAAATMALDSYILLLPLAIAVKYGEVLIRQ